MSEENVEIVRDAIEAFSDEGVDAALEYCDPEIEWWAPPEWLEDRLYKGHEVGARAGGVLEPAVRSVPTGP